MNVFCLCRPSMGQILYSRLQPYWVLKHLYMVSLQNTSNGY